MKGNKVYLVKNTLEHQGHFRSHIIIMKDYMFYLAEFNNMDQFNFFLDTLGIKFILDEIRDEGTEKELKIGYLDYLIQDDFVGGFWDLSNLPKNRKPIKGLSNGSIVTCYFSKDSRSKKITWYRPNPNAKNVYKPLEIEEHIAHQKIYGSY